MRRRLRGQGGWERSGRRARRAHQVFQKLAAAVRNSVSGGEHLERLDRHLQVLEQVSGFEGEIAAVRELADLRNDKDARDEDQRGVEGIVEREPPEAQQVAAVLDLVDNFNRLNGQSAARNTVAAPGPGTEVDG